MNKLPLISIAMATYNGERFLREQLDSILGQTYLNLEIIICDDNSTDSTQDILLEYANSDHRIKVFRNNTNIGLVKNFEQTLSLCTGAYIALADQDDIWLPAKVEILLSKISNFALIHSDARLIDVNNTVFAQSYSHYSKKDLHKDFIDYLLGNNATGCTMLFQAKLLDVCLPIPETVFVHDWWIALHAYKYGGITYFNDSLIDYRQHENNQIGAGNPNTFFPFEIRLKHVKQHILYLYTIQKSLPLTDFEQDFIISLIQYYDDFFSKTFRFRSIFFYLTNITRFHKSRNFFYKIAGLILSFFGQKIQQKIWVFACEKRS